MGGCVATFNARGGFRRIVEPLRHHLSGVPLLNAVKALPLLGDNTKSCPFRWVPASHRLTYRLRALTEYN